MPTAKITENTMVSLSLLIAILLSTAAIAWSLSSIHRDIDGLKRIAIAQMGSRWRCAPQMIRWADDLSKFNPELIVPKVECENDVDILNFTELRQDFPAYP